MSLLLFDQWGRSRPLHGSRLLLAAVVHGPAYFTGSYKLQHGAFADAFHVFALLWDPDHLYFFVDGINYATLSRTALADQAYWVFNHPFDILLDVPVGGWSGNHDATTVFPQRMYVAYPIPPLKAPELQSWG